MSNRYSIQGKKSHTEKKNNWHERVSGIKPRQGTPLAVTHRPMGLKDDMEQRDRSTFAILPPTVTL